MAVIKIELPLDKLDNNTGAGGIEIKIPGFKNNPACPEEGQIFIEYYEGVIKVHVWKGEQDPETTIIEPGRNIFVPVETCQRCKHEDEPDTHANCQKCIVGDSKDNGFEEKDNAE
jgi:hypothetical protein